MRGHSKKDPKKILDAFRTDVRPPRNTYTDLLRQFELERPNRGRNRRKFQPLKNAGLSNTAAILSLCLVTGISAGAGTAFAQEEISPEGRPIDQPASQPKVEREAPVKNEKKVERTLSNQHPQEQKITKETKESQLKEESPQAEQKKVAEKVPEITVPKETTVQVHKPEPSNQPEKETTETKTPTPSEPQKESMPTGDQPPQESNQPPQTNSEGMDKSEASKLNREKQSNNKSPADSAQEWVAKTGATSRAAKSHSSQNQARAAKSSTLQNRPRTVDGGELPDTAGNDLNGVVVGSGLALLGSLYALRRRKADRS